MKIKLVCGNVSVALPFLEEKLKIASEKGYKPIAITSHDKNEICILLEKNIKDEKYE